MRVEYVPETAAVFVEKTVGWQIYEEPEAPNLPFPIVSDSWSKHDTTLYLSIASFRDKLCPNTLFNLFSKAYNPKRITVGVVQQNAPDDVDCLEEYCSMMKKSAKFLSLYGENCPFEKNIRMMRVDSKTAKGPTWGRAKASTLIGDEEFCMQTDAHMDFVPDWDVRMMEMWAATNNEYAVLSTYVADFAQLQYNDKPDSKGLGGLHEVPHLCMITLDGSHSLVRVHATKCARNLPHPKLTNAVWGAGLSFSKCHAERKVPYDPHTPFIFDGEEFSRALRFWTSGYDIYTPHRVYVVHHYQLSQTDPNHFDWYKSKADPSEGTLEKSVFRLKTLLEMPGGATDKNERLVLQKSKYGLGDRRTLSQAIEFSGVDTRNRAILGNRCGNIKYVPFIEHPYGPDYVPPYDPITEEYLSPRDPGSIYYNSSSSDSIKNWENSRELHVDVDIGKESVAANMDMSGIDHIMHVSSAYGHGLHSHHHTDSSLLMVFLLVLVGLAFNFFCRRRCHIGKTSNSSVECNGSFVKTV